MKYLPITALLTALLVPNVFAADADSQGDDLAALSQEMNNPLADLWMLFTQNDYLSLEDEQGDEYDINSFKFQPVMSFDFSENYNLIVRPTLQHVSIEAPGIRRENGLGDTGVLAAITPKESSSGWVFGAGFTSLFPTAEEEFMTTLGADQSLFGPALVTLKIGPQHTYGAVVQHFEGFGSTNYRDRNGRKEDVSLTDIQYIYRYRISPTTQIGMAPNIQIDWNQRGSDRFSVPIGGGIDHMTKWGNTPVRLGIEAYYYVEQNDQFGPDWAIRFFIIPVIANPF